MSGDRLARERARRRKEERRAATTAKPSIDPSGEEHAALTEAQRRRRAASTCGWCGGVIELRVRGRIPKWCSAACRQRAWEQTRAAASGRSAIEVVERRVEVPVDVQVAVPDPQVAASRARPDWPQLLQRLATDLDSGAVYRRDLRALADALDEVAVSFNRRAGR